jgi:hypothetical protein
MTNYIEQFKSARNVSVPLIVIRTPDYAGTMKAIMSSAPSFIDDNGATVIVPYCEWNIAQGLTGLNKQGESAASVINDGAAPALTTANPQEAMQLALERLPADLSLIHISEPTRHRP